MADRQKTKPTSPDDSSRSVKRFSQFMAKQPLHVIADPAKTTVAVEKIQALGGSR